MRTELASDWPPSAATAKKAGHPVRSPMKAIREKCLDCCCGNDAEVRRCETVECALWPFRSGKHPYTAKRRIGAEELPTQSETEKNDEEMDLEDEVVPGK